MTTTDTQPIDLKYIEVVRTASGIIYRTVIARLALLALYEMVLEAQAQHPDVAYIGTDTNDQDTEGGQWISSWLGVGMEMLEEDVDSGTASLDMDSRTGGTWGKFTDDDLRSLAKDAGYSFDNLFVVEKIVAEMRCGDPFRLTHQEDDDA